MAVFFLIYLIMMLDQLKAAFSSAIPWVGGISLVVWIGGTIVWWMGRDTPSFADKGKTLNSAWDQHRISVNKWAKRGLVIWAIIWGTNAVLPSSRDAAIILAASQTYSVLTGETAQELAGETTAAIKRMLNKVGVTEELAQELQAENANASQQAQETLTKSEAPAAKVEPKAEVSVVTETTTQVAYVEDAKAMVNDAVDYVKSIDVAGTTQQVSAALSQGIDSATTHASAAIDKGVELANKLGESTSQLNNALDQLKR